MMGNIATASSQIRWPDNPYATAASAVLSAKYGNVICRIEPHTANKDVPSVNRMTPATGSVLHTIYTTPATISANAASAGLFKALENAMAVRTSVTARLVVLKSTLETWNPLFDG